MVDHLQATLESSLSDVAPKSRFATQTIAFFLQSLSDGELPSAPALAQIPSMTTLVPHYDEDVMYAISPEFVLKELEAGSDCSKLKVRCP